MFSITLKLMKKSARMLIPAGIAILIGTAFIAATFLFGNAMNDALAAQNTAQLGGANYVISPDSGKDLTDKDQDYIYTRTVNDFQLDRIRATEGVKDARASYAGSVTVTRGTSMPAATSSPPPQNVRCCRSPSRKETSRRTATRLP